MKKNWFKFNGMKKTRLFLAGSCLAVAVFGVAATKAKSANVTYYYFQSPTSCPSIVIPDPNCTGGGPACTAVVSPLGHVPLYEDAACQTPLFKS